MIAIACLAALAAAPEAGRLAVVSGVYLQERAESHAKAPPGAPRLALPRVARVRRGEDAEVWRIGDGRVYLDGRELAFPGSSIRMPLPVSPARGIAADAQGVWIATDRGLLRLPRHRRHWRYYAGRRWLPDDRVEGLACPGDGSVWVRTPHGIGRIVFEPFTLARKAEIFERRIRARHLRHGLVAPSVLARPGDLASSRPFPSDNDGLWTAIYVAAESFRHAVTKDPEAAAFARGSFRALLRLLQITGLPGFPARTFVARGEPTGSGGEWHATPDGRWLWKGDTSSDEIDGHFFALAIFADLVADPPERRRAAEAARAIADPIIRNGFYLIDLDGEPTRWGVWAPEKLDGDPSWWRERGLNALEILSHLAVTERLTGDARYGRVARTLIDEHGYARNAVRQKIADPPEEVNHSDDELAFLAYYNLLRYERDPALRAQYLAGLGRTWTYEGPERNPLWTFIAASARWPGITRESIEAAVDGLRRTPLDMRNWTMRNAHRADLARSAHRNRFGALCAARVLLPEERGALKYNADPYELDAGGGGNEEEDGAFFLLAYWMGRYHGFLREAEAGGETRRPSGRALPPGPGGRRIGDEPGGRPR